MLWEGPGEPAVQCGGEGTGEEFSGGNPRGPTLLIPPPPSLPPSPDVALGSSELGTALACVILLQKLPTLM